MFLRPPKRESLLRKAKLYGSFSNVLAECRDARSGSGFPSKIYCLFTVK